MLDYVEYLFDINKHRIEVLSVLEILSDEHFDIEDLLCTAASWSLTCLNLCNNHFRLWLQSLKDDSKCDFAGMTVAGCLSWGR